MFSSFPTTLSKPLMQQTIPSLSLTNEDMPISIWNSLHEEEIGRQGDTIRSTGWLTHRALFGDIHCSDISALRLIYSDCGSEEDRSAYREAYKEVYFGYAAYTILRKDVQPMEIRPASYDQTLTFQKTFVQHGFGALKEMPPSPTTGYRVVGDTHAGDILSFIQSYSDYFDESIRLVAKDNFIILYTEPLFQQHKTYTRILGKWDEPLVKHAILRFAAFLWIMKETARRI